MKGIQKQAIFIIIGVLICAAALIGGYTFFTGRVTVPAREVLVGKPELQTFYDKALQFEAQIAENPAELTNYLTVGGSWKLIADSTHDSQWYKLALKAYERGISVTQEKNSLFLTNAGQIEEELGNYKKAKSYYLAAIDLSPGDAGYHLLYIKLLRYKLGATSEEILGAYDIGMSRVISGADLVSSRAQYLISIGHYDDAQKDLELLFKNNVISQAQLDSELLDIKNLKESAK